MNLRFLTILILAWSIGAGASFAQSSGLKLIVNDQNRVSNLSRAEIVDIYLKRTVFWPSGEPIRPADRNRGSQIRERFFNTILRRSESSIRNYWQQRIFTGRGVPPPEMDSDRGVIGFVRRYPGAIGYVSADTQLPEGVHVLEVR